MSETKKYRSSGSTTGGIYGLAFLGSLIYYITHAAGFWSIVIGVLKAVVWPAFLVYELMAYLQM